LKTKTSAFKKHWATLDGNELICYRKPGDEEYRVIHCLSGTFLLPIPNELGQYGETVYPLKIILSPNLSRVLYFDTQQQQQKWSALLQKVMG